MLYNSLGKMEASEVDEKKSCEKVAIFSSFVIGNQYEKLANKCLKWKFEFLIWA